MKSDRGRNYSETTGQEAKILRMGVTLAKIGVRYQHYNNHPESPIPKYIEIKCEIFVKKGRLMYKNSNILQTNLTENVKN